MALAVTPSRGGRTTKIHVLTDGLGRLVAFCLTAAHVADRRAAESLLKECRTAPWSWQSAPTTPTPSASRSNSGAQFPTSPQAHPDLEKLLQPRALLPP